MNFARVLRTPFYRTPPKDCFYDERDRQKNACTQAAIRFFTVRYDILMMYLNGHSFFEYEHKIFKVFKICFLTKNSKNLNTFSSVSFYLYFYKMKTFEISCRKVKISISVFSPRWKVRVSQKKFTPGWISPRLRATYFLDLDLKSTWITILKLDWF